ncbi:MAG: DnaJ domain-containing protein, partial [Paracoccaceae bacterium]
QRSDDKVWERPTKPMGDPEARAWARLGIEDPHQVLGDNATRNPGRNAPSGGGSRRLPATERRAIEILAAKESWTKAEVRKAYKALIKVLHPDMNGGDRSQEEQLQEVVWAWDQIKDSRNFR